MKTYIIICWFFVSLAFLPLCTSKHKTGRSRRQLVKNLLKSIPRTGRCGWKQNYLKNGYNFNIYEWFNSIKDGKEHYISRNRPWLRSSYWQNLPAYNRLQAAASYWPITTPQPIVPVLPANNWIIPQTESPYYQITTPRSIETFPFVNDWDRPRPASLDWQLANLNNVDAALTAKYGHKWDPFSRWQKITVYPPPTMSYWNKVPGHDWNKVPGNNWKKYMSNRPRPEFSYWQVTPAKFDRPQPVPAYWLNLTPKVMQPVPPKPDCYLEPFITTPMNCWPHWTKNPFEWMTSTISTLDFSPESITESIPISTKEIDTLCKICKRPMISFLGTNIESEDQIEPYSNDETNDDTKSRCSLFSKNYTKVETKDDTKDDIKDNTIDDTKDNTLDDNNDEAKDETKEDSKDDNANDIDEKTENETEENTDITKDDANDVTEDGNTESTTQDTISDGTIDDITAEINTDTVDDATSDTTGVEKDDTTDNTTEDNGNGTTDAKDDTNSTDDAKEDADNDTTEEPKETIEQEQIDTRKSNRGRRGRSDIQPYSKSRKRNYRN